MWVRSGLRRIEDSGCDDGERLGALNVVCVFVDVKMIGFGVIFPYFLRSQRDEGSQSS